jgi:hypothetical protein
MIPDIISAISRLLIMSKSPSLPIIITDGEWDNWWVVISGSEVTPTVLAKQVITIILT